MSSKLVEGAVLQVESLEQVLSAVTFDTKNLKSWWKIMKDPLYKYPKEYRGLVDLLSKLKVARDI